MKIRWQVKSMQLSYSASDAARIVLAVLLCGSTGFVIAADIIKSKIKRINYFQYKILLIESEHSDSVDNPGLDKRLKIFRQCTLLISAAIELVGLPIVNYLAIKYIWIWFVFPITNTPFGLEGSSFIIFLGMLFSFILSTLNGYQINSRLTSKVEALLLSGRILIAYYTTAILSPLILLGTGWLIHYPISYFFN